MVWTNTDWTLEKVCGCRFNLPSIIYQPVFDASIIAGVSRHDRPDRSTELWLFADFEVNL